MGDWDSHTRRYDGEDSFSVIIHKTCIEPGVSGKSISAGQLFRE